MSDIRVQLLTNREVEERGIDRWGVWEKEPSEFDWEYTAEEHCYIIEGKAVISTGKKDVEIAEGDYVIFPVGLQCRWNVKRAIKKYYEFR